MSDQRVVLLLVQWFTGSVWWPKVYIHALHTVESSKLQANILTDLENNVFLLEKLSNLYSCFY